MYRFPWSVALLTFSICLPVALLALGLPIPFFDFNRVGSSPRPLPVPEGDQEIAWLNTTTNGGTWERFVTGAARVPSMVPGLQVDDSAAYIDQTTAVPELVLSVPNRKGKLRIRWYKLANEATAEQWIAALAQRTPAPLAIIGGGSSDRAADLARSLKDQTEWHGDRPLLMLTQATADEIHLGQNLIDLYAGRTFRFCFTNRQMAEAVLDFVWSTPDLKPETFASLVPSAVGSGAVEGLNLRPKEPMPHVFSVYWVDDPFSSDLLTQFQDALWKKEFPSSHFLKWSVPSSIGGFLRPNQDECRVAGSMLKEILRLPPERSLLVLPAVTKPAQRLLHTLCESTPNIGSRMVAVTGDGISMNSIYRDGEFQWPVQSLPVPLVLFTHNNPVGWTTEDPNDPAPDYPLLPPTSTEDVLHFAELIQAVTEACFAIHECRPTTQKTDSIVNRAQDLALGLNSRCPPMFDSHGNRLGGSGEYVVVLRPREEPVRENRERAHATLEVWRRNENQRWIRLRILNVDQRQYRSTTSSEPLAR